jgi:hypothetical protein
MGFLLFNVAGREARQGSDDPVVRTPNHNPITDGGLRVRGGSDRQLGRARAPIVHRVLIDRAGGLTHEGVGPAKLLVDVAAQVDLFPAVP